MNYCYARVSTEEQHLDRQIAAFKPFEPYNLFTDKESGKDFNRTNYQKMKRKLRGGDILIVLSLDRFGRNYDQVKKEWQWFTEKNIKIKIIDMPIIDTTHDDLTAKLISDIVINLLSYVAQTEREFILKRQAEGIKAARARGVKFGRPRIKLPSNFNEVAARYVNNEIDNLKACEILGLARGTFFRYLKEFGFDKQSVKYPKNKYFTPFIRDCISFLEKGDEATVFNSEQLNQLIKIYGNDLTREYHDEGKLWICKILKVKKEG